MSDGSLLTSYRGGVRGVGLIGCRKKKNLAKKRKRLRWGNPAVGPKKRGGSQEGRGQESDRGGLYDARGKKRGGGTAPEARAIR